MASAILGLFACPAPSAAEPRLIRVVAGKDYDAAWWRTIAPDEKFGFILGVQECQLLNLHRMVGIVAIEEVQVAMMDKFAAVFYPQHPDESMAGAWEDMTTTKTRATPKTISDYNASEGDSEFWASRATAESHRGFLEGHIACRERHGSLRWSKPIGYYLDKLDRYYNPDLKYGQNQGEDSISSQLTKYADSHLN